MRSEAVRELVVGIAGAGKTRHCLARSQAALAAGRPVLYLVPNADEAGLVRRRLLEAAGGGAVFLPGILTCRLLARRILDGGLPGWSERDPLARRLALRALVERWQGRLGPPRFERSAQTPGFLAALDELLAELAMAALPPAALTGLAAQAATAEDRRRLEALAGLAADFAGDPLQLDPPALLARAAALAAADPQQALADALAGNAAPSEALLVLDGFSHLSALELGLLEALLPAAGEACLALCLDPGDLAVGAGPRPPFEGLHALAQRCLEQGGWTLLPLGATRRAGSPWLRGLAARLFRPEAAESAPAEAAPATDAAAAADDAVGLIVGATPQDEAEGVLREIRRALAAGQAPEELAVLYRQETTGELLAGLLAAAGIPFAGERRRALTRFAAVDQALVLLDWAGGAAPADLPQRLRGGVGTPEPLLAELQALGSAQGLPAAAPWAPCFAAARAGDPEADWAWLDWRESLPAGPLAGGAWLERVVTPLLALLAKPLAAQLEACLLTAGRTPELAVLAADARALERLQAVAAGLAAALPAPRPPAAWAEWLRREADAESLAIPLGQEGGGLLLGNPFSLRLPELHTVFVCGLNEGQFPPAFREDPLLRDGERRALGGALPDRRQRLARERYLFYVACTRPAARLWLSWAKRDASGRPLAPSQFLAELRRLSPHWPEPRQLPALAMAEKLRDPVDRRALLRDCLLAGARREAPALASAAERWLRAQGEGSRLDAAARPRQEQALAGHPALGPHLESMLRLSASRLEAFAECPYRYLGTHLLGLEAAEDYEPGAREEGILLHRILELAYAAGTAPAPEGLAALHERAIAELATAMPGLASPRFRAGDARRLSLLAGFLARDAARIAACGFAPRPGGAELRFALPLAELPGGPEAADAGVLVTGVVDRVDADAAGRELVIDYKSGKAAIDPPDSEAPRRFQLALYAIARGREALLAGAAYCQLREAKPLRGYFSPDLEPQFKAWTTSGDQGRHWLDTEPWDAWLAQVAQRLRGIVGAIRAGQLAPAPRDGLASCRCCALRPLCRWEEEAELDDD
jgi:ATP-dependent helicase/DNAse subunit B